MICRESFVEFNVDLCKGNSKICFMFLNIFTVDSIYTHFSSSLKHWAVYQSLENKNVLTK